MKSVCIISYNPFKYGGIERVISTIANSLSEDYEVTLLCIDKTAEIDRGIYNLNEKIKIIFTDVDQYYHKYFHILERTIQEIHKKTNIFNQNEKLINFAYFNRHKKLISNIKEIINNNAFDYVIGANAFFSMILGMIKSDCHSKMIGWQHSNYSSYFERNGYYYYKQEILAKRYFKNLDQYVTLLDYDKIALKEKLDVNATVIPNPKSFSSKEKSKLTNNTFISTGRFVDAKGFDLLIDSFYLFSKENSDWNLVIVGDGENREKLQEQINNYNLSNRVTLHPFTKDVQSLLIDSSIYLCSSRWEGFGLSVLEALECGLPVISFNIPAMQELLKNTPELLVNVNNTQEYAKKMVLLTNTSKKLLSNLVKENNKKLKEYESIGLYFEKEGVKKKETKYSYLAMINAMWCSNRELLKLWQNLEQNNYELKESLERYKRNYKSVYISKKNCTSYDLNIEKIDFEDWFCLLTFAKEEFKNNAIKLLNKGAMKYESIDVIADIMDRYKAEELFRKDNELLLSFFNNLYNNTEIKSHVDRLERFHESFKKCNELYKELNSNM